MKYAQTDIEKSIQLYNFITSVNEREKPFLKLVNEPPMLARAVVNKIVVAFGSYDPLTIAHNSFFQKGLEIAEKQIARKEGFTHLLLLTTTNHAHKKVDFQKNASLQDRLKMLEIFKKQNVSYGLINDGIVVNSIKEIEKLYYELTDIYFLFGADLLEKIIDKKFYDDSLEKTERALEKLFEHRLIITERKVGEKNKTVQQIIEENKILLPYENKILQVNYDAEEFVEGIHVSDISSTLVREKIKKGEDVKSFLVCKEIKDFITNLELYLNNNNYSAFTCAVQMFADNNKNKKVEEYIDELINYLSQLDSNEELKRKTIQFYKK